MRSSAHIFFAVILLVTAHLSQAQSSVLREGKWAKFGVEKTGVYKINYDLIKKAGVDPSTINPANIRMFGFEAGMLPQANSATTISDLPEIAIFVSGDNDGKFDKSDYVLFYAQHPDKVFYDVAKKTFAYEKNYYSNKSFYFLTVGTTAGKRITISPNIGSATGTVSTFNDYAYYELEDINILKSGREWLGEYFGVSRVDLTVPFNVEGISRESDVTFISHVVGVTSTTSTFKISINNNEILQQKLLPIAGSQYGSKGIYKRDTLRFNASAIGFGANTKQEIKYSIVKDADGSKAYLDKFMLSFERQLALYGDQTQFVAAKSLNNPVSEFQIGSFVSGSLVWDVTDFYNVVSQDFATANNVATFATTTDKLKKFIVFNSKTTAPEFVGQISNQDLHGLQVPDLVIVTHPTFLPEAERLAAHRRTHNNISVSVVTTDQVFNEFSGGRQDVSAIRNFMKVLYDRSPGTLKSLLLFGKGSYDYKDILPNNTNFVCTYESRNSLHPLLTYSSDDYFGFLENTEGNWGEEPIQNHTLDIGVGRLPVVSLDAAKNVVDKIISYEQSKKSLGYWRKEVVFIADDGNGDDGYTNLHQSQADQLANFVEARNPSFDAKRLFIGTYQKETRPSGERIPELADEIVRAFDRGSLIINYTGHGGEGQLADESIINTIGIDKLENKLYPFVVTATCEFGRNDNPADVSGAERLVTREKGGAIGMVTTARPVNATTNFDLNRAFYEALLDRKGHPTYPIGEVFRRTKNNSISGVANRNFTLLGDPSLALAIPADTIVLTLVKTATNSDTLKALSTVKVKGEVQTADGSVNSGFNGVAEITLFDQPIKYTTIGRNNPPYTFQQYDNILFRGQAQVMNGKFDLSFILPASIPSSVSTGKIGVYAADPTTLSDAAGGSAKIRIGGKEITTIADNTGPTIEMFLSDTTFVNGGITQPNTTLLIKLADATGINTSTYDPTKNMIATLDSNGKSYVVNAYFVADVNQPGSGRVVFPLNDLPKGKQRLLFSASDVLGNTTTSFLDFVVSDSEDLVVANFVNYPNPFSQSTTLTFTHNRPGDDLQAQVLILSLTGELVKTAEVTIVESDYQVNVMELTPDSIDEKKLPAGLYLARLIVRSVSNGSKYEQVTKLIVVN